MSGRNLRIIRAAPAGGPALDTALSRAILLEVDAGTRPETLRLYPPADAVAFSVVDRRRPGFPAALRVAREAGFGATLRLAGGRAALFQREGLAFAWSRASSDPRAEVNARFQECAEWICNALRSLGIDARIGEVPGEYCPGAHSVNAGGRRKLAGIGQRVVRRAAHVGGVISVGGSGRARAVLREVYRALDYELDVETIGSIETERPQLGTEAVVEALLAPFGEGSETSEAIWGLREWERGRALEAQHRLDGAS